jgi:hypothetical protein
MLRAVGIRVLCALAVLVAVWSPAVMAQDDPNDVPLGDVARNLRKTSQQSKQVIDDDNLSDVMEQKENGHSLGSSVRYLMAGGDSKGFQLAAPDVTCSLAFTANVKALLSKTQYSEMELPAAELAKLEGPAVIEGDALTITLFNATNWHVSEIVVAFTSVNKRAESSADNGGEDAFQEVRPEKKQDSTLIYKMRAGAAPWMRAVFSVPLGVDLRPGDEWHWAIVQAKGYPPESASGATAAQTITPAASQGLSSAPDAAAAPAQSQ